MKLKILSIALSITIVACFYFQSQQIIELQNRVESLQSNMNKSNENFKSINIIFRILIKEIQKTSNFIA
jgi:hypothetical protein